MIGKDFPNPDDAVQARMTGFLRRYPAKTLANITGVEVSTATGWRKGNWPAGPALRRMIATWGESFLSHVFAPLLDETDVSLQRRLDRMEADLTAIREAQNADIRTGYGPALDRHRGIQPRKGKVLDRTGTNRRIAAC